jgi:DNA-binding response OmpR family regulator
MAKILIVDDELDICLILTKHFKNLLFETHYATTVKQARLNIQLHTYYLMFIDLNLLEGSGYDIIKYVHEVQVKTKIIVISAHDSEATRAIENGADLFIAKPFTIQIINEALKTVNILPA